MFWKIIIAIVVIEKLLEEIIGDDDVKDTNETSHNSKKS